jgi:hypothetical protein
MARGFFSEWRTRLDSRTRKHPPSKQNHFRPQVELLEARCLMSRDAADLSGGLEAFWDRSPFDDLNLALVLSATKDRAAASVAAAYTGHGAEAGRGASQAEQPARPDRISPPASVSSAPIVPAGDMGPTGPALPLFVPPAAGTTPALTPIQPGVPVGGPLGSVHIAYVSMQNGNWSDPATWGGIGVPGAGDSATIANGTTVTVDVNTTVGSKTSPVGDAITINGASSTSFGKLIVAPGVTLTLSGFGSTSNRMLRVNQYGQFNPQAGSTILGDVMSSYSSCMSIAGQVIAVGTASKPITFSVPTANIPSWAVPVTGEIHSGLTAAMYDGVNGVSAVNLGSRWIANAEGTGLGSSTDSSVSFSAQAPSTILTTEVSSIAAVNDVGEYYVNYDTGILYFYTRATSSFTVSYTKLDPTVSAWHGWGIQVNGNTSYNSGDFEYCNFSYLGDATHPANNSVIYFANKLSAGANAGSSDRLAKLVHSSFTFCQQCVTFDNCVGTANDNVKCQYNTFNDAGGSNATFFGVNFGNAVSSYVSVSNNTLDLRFTFISTTNWGSTGNACSHLSINHNTGYCSCFMDGVIPGVVVMPDGQVNFNTIRAYGNCNGGALYVSMMAMLGGTAGHRLSFHGNDWSFSGLFLASPASYTIWDGNWFHDFYSGGFSTNNYNPSGRGVYLADLVIQNNLFTGRVLGGGSYLLGIRSIELGTNCPIWIDGLIIQNNTLLDNNLGAITIGGSFDPGSVMLVTGAQIRNNLIVNAANQGAVGSAFYQYPNLPGTEGTGRGNQSSIQLLELDYNGYFQSGVPYLNLPRGGSFMRFGAKYNFDTTRHIKGVALSRPGYSTPQTTARSLSYTVNVRGVDETLSWGGGAPVQLIQDHGTATGGTATTLIDTSKSWSTTLTDPNCPAGSFVKIISGRGVGQTRAVTMNTATTLSVVSSWNTPPDATSVYAIYKPEVTLTDADQKVYGLTINNGSSGYHSPPTVTISGGGGTGATATCTIDANGTVVGTTIVNPGSGYTGIPTVTVSPAGATLSATLGSVVADIDPRYLPSSSQTDAGITLAFHDQTGDPLLVQPIVATPTDAIIQPGSSAQDTGTNARAPAKDYFGTKRPQGPAVDLGFDELV